MISACTICWGDGFDMQGNPCPFAAQHRLERQALDARSGWHYIDVTIDAILARLSPDRGQVEASVTCPDCGGNGYSGGIMPAEDMRGEYDVACEVCCGRGRIPADRGQAMSTPDDRWLPIDTCEAWRYHHLNTILANWTSRGVCETYWDEDDDYDTRPRGWKSPREGWRSPGDMCIPVNQSDVTHWQLRPAPPSTPDDPTEKEQACSPKLNGNGNPNNAALLHRDDAETALFQAIQSIRIGNKTDDKLILAELEKAGIWLARIATTATPSTHGVREALEDQTLRLGRFCDAVEQLPWVAKRLRKGQQFNTYESGRNDENAADEDRVFYIGIGPISDFRFIGEVEGKAQADLIEAGLKLAALSALSKEQVR